MRVDGFEDVKMYDTFCVLREPKLKLTRITPEIVESMLNGGLHQEPHCDYYRRLPDGDIKI